ncbi:tail fiber domain-containing protein [bacterium 210702-DFI.5.13]|nr:tail fiber domain-containing protein [bacterium 210702-DFI.5.13]
MIFEQPVNIYSQDYVLKRFQSNETAVQVVRGKLSALISESELIELQNSKATMYSKLASAVLDINSLQLQFSDISSKYDTVTGQYSSLDAKVADYKAGLDGLSVNLTNLSTRINNDYSTTTAMNAAIKASVDGLSSTVSQTYATTQNVKSSLAEADTNAKKYADSAQNTAISQAQQDATSKADAAESNAKADTDNKLKSYSTTIAMNSAIKQMADSITLSVSKTYATGADLSAGLSGADQKAKNYADSALQSADKSAKGYADAAQSAAVKAANANTEELLKSYPTVTAMESAIKQNADSITASVSKTYATKEGLSDASTKISNLETWKSQAELKITDSAIVSTVTSSTSWSKKADKASLISQINQSAESISINASKINLNGVVTANSYFCILTDGSIKSIKGTLGGWTISSDKIQSRFAGIDAMTIHSDGYLKFGTCKISSTGGALTVKNGLHLYTNVNTDSSGFDDGTERFKIFGLGHVSSGGHLVFDSDGATVSYLSSSSRRYKYHIRDMTDNDIQNLYKLPTVFFIYKPGYLEKDSAVPIPGLYAEDVEQYLPLAARYQNGLIEDWNERAVIPYLIKAIQLQHEEIEALKRKVA